MSRMFFIILLCAMITGFANADFLDEFDSTALNPGWRIFNEDTAYWSLTERPGFLRLKSQYFSGTPSNFFYHIEVINGNFESTIRLIAHPDSAGQSVLMSADFDSLFSSPRALVGFGNLLGIGSVVFYLFCDTIYGGTFYSDTMVYLRLRTNSDTIFAEYSSNNTDWINIGSYYDSHYSQLQTAGLMALNHPDLGGSPQTPAMNADIDWYHLVALTVVEEGAAGKPDMQSKVSATPNPFRVRTDIRYKIHDARCKNGMLKIFDATGRLVKQFNHLAIQPFDQITWSGDDQNGLQVPAGVYFIRSVDDGAAAVRIVKIR